MEWPRIVPGPFLSLWFKYNKRIETNGQYESGLF
jgi:hypothetical protein